MKNPIISGFELLFLLYIFVLCKRIISVNNSSIAHTVPVSMAICI